MINILSQISKYLLLFFMAVCTIDDAFTEDEWEEKKGMADFAIRTFDEFDRGLLSA